MTPNMERGAWIIIHEWVRVKAWDKVLIVTSKEHQAEAKALEMQARKKARSVNTLIVENKGRHVGIFFDDNEAVFDPYTAIIAATEYSLVTTKAAKRAIQKHKKFLSLPLSTDRWDTSDEPMSRRESSSKAAESSISRRHRPASA